MRYAWPVGILICIALTTSAVADGPVYAKIRFSIRENGNFAGSVFTTLGTPEAAALVTAGCAAYGVDCSSEAAAGAALLKSLASGDAKNGIDHHGIYRAPVGYEICKAKIDWGHTAPPRCNRMGAVCA